MRKTLIESRSVEMLKLFDKVSEDARKEKLASPPITKLLYYWTKKPLVVGRAVALASTLDDMDVMHNLMGFRDDTRAYKIPPDLERYAKALGGSKASEIKVLDPFAGSGNLMFAAKRLGLDCTCGDYNPVAHMLQRAALEFPSKHGKKLVDLFEQYASQMLDKTKKEMSEFYGDGDLAYFWVWCVKCPHCDQRIPLANNMWIANTAKKKVGIKFHVAGKDFEVELVNNMTFSEGKKFTQKNGAVICISCKNTVDKKIFTADIAKRKDRELIVIQKNINGKRVYTLATKNDKERYQQACHMFKKKTDELIKFNLIPSEEIKASHRKENLLWKFGIKNWSSYYSPRQLLVFTTLMRNIQDVLKDAGELAAPISVYLAFWLCKHMNNNSFGVVWATSRETTAHTLTLRRPSFVTNHVEMNPFEKSSGSLLNMQENIKKGLEFVAKDSNQVNILLDSVTNIPKKFPKKYDLIITDPPYLDDVIYGEDSEFFYVWIIRIIGKYFPDMPKTVPLEEDFCQSWGRFGDKSTALEFFENGLKRSFISMRESLKDDGLLVVFFAHSSTYGWNILLECVRNAKFQVMSSYAIHTESTANVLARGKTSFMSSIVVACRKIRHDSSAYYEDVRPEAEDSIKSMLDKIPADRLLTIPITDLLIMTFGQILEVCTKFTELKSYRAEFEPNFENLIAGSRDFIMKELVSKITGSSINFIGPRMAFYILARVFFSGRIPPDDAIKITHSLNVEKSSLERDSVARSDQGALIVAPLHESKQDTGPEGVADADLYQQACILASACHAGGIGEVLSVMSKSDKFKIVDLKKVVTLLVKSYRMQTNRGKALGKAEREEMRIMEALSDMWGGVAAGGTLEGFS